MSERHLHDGRFTGFVHGFFVAGRFPCDKRMSSNLSHAQWPRFQWKQGGGQVREERLYSVGNALPCPDGDGDVFNSGI
mgnify:FL=1